MLGFSIKSNVRIDEPSGIFHRDHYHTITHCLAAKYPTTDGKTHFNRAAPIAGIPFPFFARTTDLTALPCASCRSFVLYLCRFLCFLLSTFSLPCSILNAISLIARVIRALCLLNRILLNFASFVLKRLLIIGIVLFRFSDMLIYYNRKIWGYNIGSKSKLFQRLRCKVYQKISIITVEYSLFICIHKKFRFAVELSCKYLNLYKVSSIASEK